MLLLDLGRLGHGVLRGLPGPVGGGLGRGRRGRTAGLGLGRGLTQVGGDEPGRLRVLDHPGALGPDGLDAGGLVQDLLRTAAAEEDVELAGVAAALVHLGGIPREGQGRLVGGRLRGVGLGLRVTALGGRLLQLELSAVGRLGSVARRLLERVDAVPGGGELLVQLRDLVGRGGGSGLGAGHLVGRRVHRVGVRGAEREGDAGDQSEAGEDGDARTHDAARGTGSVGHERPLQASGVSP